MSKSGEALSKALVVAPNAALSVFRTIMDVAIDGAGPLPGARKAAGATLNRKGEIEAAIDGVFDLRPAAIVDALDLKRPIYQPAAAYGHFGRATSSGVAGSFPWERTNRVEALQRLARA